jgi:putative SOS response-associated peptidase YedK
MCGRYTLVTDPRDLADEFELPEVVEFPRRYNIAPSQNAPIVRRAEEGGARRLDLLRWGLVPHWAKDLKFGYRTINARAETVATQPAYRSAFRRRRCLVPASGFYEWQKSVKAGKEVKQPYYVHRRDDRPMALAGLWDSWSGPDGAAVETFTIVTTDANEMMSPLHNRMPVILGSEDYDAWLALDAGVDRLQSLLRPSPCEWLAATAVSREVNNPRNDGPGCVAPL